jgi:protein SCO1
VGVAQSQGLQDGANVEFNDSSPKEVEEVTVVQNLGQKIPLNLALKDWMGRDVKTARFFDGQKPTIVTLNYSDCPVLCSVQLNQLTESLRALDLELGTDFRILTVSINPKETTERVRETREKYVGQLDGKGGEEGWAFCTAPQSTINALSETLGFKYTFDKLTGQYFHPAMLAFVSPDGVITRYSLDVSFPTDQMRLAILESGEGKVGSPVDLFILRCFSYDPDRNSYVLGAWRLMRFGGAATIGLLLAVLTPYWIGRKRAPNSVSDAEPIVGVEK